MKAAIYAWHRQQWLRLWHLYQMQRLSPAWLFYGVEGVGKRCFTRAFVQAVLCQRVGASGEACGDCHACHMIRATTHPNLLWVQEEAFTQIKIEQSRVINQFVQQTALQPGLLIVVIDRAECLNDHAANALLKILEEPPSTVLFILLNHQMIPDIMPTVLSRCQRLAFPVPATTITVPWLCQALPALTQPDAERLVQLTGGPPLLALKWGREGVLALRQQVFDAFCQLACDQTPLLRYAEQWQVADIRVIFHLIESIINDLLHLHVGGLILNRDYHVQWTILMKQLLPSTLITFANYLQQLKRMAFGSGQLNKQTLLETLLIHWVKQFN